MRWSTALLRTSVTLSAPPGCDREAVTNELTVDDRLSLTDLVATMERLRRYESTFHLLGQVRFSGGPDTARGVAYCEAHHLLVESARRTDHVMYIRYDDRFVRTRGGWRIAYRKLEVGWVDAHLVTASA